MSKIVSIKFPSSESIRFDSSYVVLLGKYTADVARIIRSVVFATTKEPKARTLTVTIPGRSPVITVITDESSKYAVVDSRLGESHHEVIAASLNAWAQNDRQVVLETQNPWVVDFLPPVKSAAQAAERFIRCVDGTGRNLTEAESQAFFDACSAGIQHPSEILRTSGLW